MHLQSAVLKDENERLRRSVDQYETQVRSLQQGIQATNQTETDERQSLKDEISVSKKVVSDLQRQLDEARGEISVLNRKLTSSVRVSQDFLMDLKTGINSSSLFNRN